jgi:peptidoglycan/LPS O-acetylase OafA/YrhL
VPPSPADAVPQTDPRMPGLAMAAGALGILGAVPPLFVAVLAVMLGGLNADTGPDPWTYLLLVAPVVQLAGALWLLLRRGWLPLVLSVLPVAVLTGAVVVTATREDVGSPAWPLVLVVLPVLAAALALTPRVRRWTAGRPRRAPVASG